MSMRPPEFLMPYARAIKYAMKWRRARSDAARPYAGDGSAFADPPRFVLGCGRSGTTIIGKIFGVHPDVCYLFEPYHLWAAVDRRTDMINFYGQVDAHCLMDESFADDAARLKFRRAIHAERVRSGRPTVIEKTPINAMRLGYLSALSPGSRIVHMVRDGVDVARSIGRLSVKHEYNVVGRKNWNAWWGADDCKWRFLAADGARAGYFVDEAAAIENHEQRGAYEWLVSLEEIEKHRAGLGDLLLDIRYDELTSSPRSTIERICAHFAIAAPAEWLARAESMLDKERKNEGEPLVLPPRMGARFNELQAKYGFGGRAATRA